MPGNTTQNKAPPLAPAVKAAFDAQPGPIRNRLLELRDLIFETAARTDGIGALTETLKWGEPAYLPKKPRIGTTLRINGVKDMPNGYALYYHCQTSLYETFSSLYPNEFRYEGRRSIIFEIADTLPREALSHCVAIALTYHLKRTNTL